MEQVSQLGQLIGTYGVSIVIVILFLWDYIAEKKKMQENQEIMKSTLSAVQNTTETMVSCLNEIKSTNSNTAKSLELLQNQMETTDKKNRYVTRKEEIICNYQIRFIMY